MGAHVDEPRDDEQLEMVHQLRRLVVALEHFGSGFATMHGMNSTDVRALIGLLDRERAGEPASPGWLGTHLGLNSASTTALVDRLERAQLVVRERGDADRRRVTIVVTDHARTLGWAFFGPLIDGVVGVTAGFSGVELDTVRRFLDAVTHAVGDARHM